MYPAVRERYIWVSFNINCKCVHKLDYTVPVCPTVQFVTYADCICSLFFKILIPVLVSLLCNVWQSGHFHFRTARFFTNRYWKTTVTFWNTWHSPQLKQGDSCFFHYCIGEYPTVLQCLHSVHKLCLSCSRMPYGTVFIFTQTASAALFSRY